MMLAIARIYLGLEWLSGALMGMILGLAWTGIVGIAYRQRAFKRFSGIMASLIFYLSFFGLFAWQVQEHLSEDMGALQSPMVLVELDRQSWWQSRWREMPEDRTRLASVSSRRFNAQVAVDPGEIAARLAAAGWERVPETDWRWVLQALNPEPDEASLPLLGRAYMGRSEELLLRRDIRLEGRLLTIRLWDSGIRLTPGRQVLYLGQLSEEVLVQRFGLFSYWKSAEMSRPLQQQVEELLAGFDWKRVDGDVVLIRE